MNDQVHVHCLCIPDESPDAARPREGTTYFLFGFAVYFVLTVPLQVCWAVYSFWSGSEAGKTEDDSKNVLLLK